MRARSSNEASSEWSIAIEANHAATKPPRASIRHAFAVRYADQIGICAYFPAVELFSFAFGSGDTSDSVGENRGTSMRCSKCGFDNPAGMRICGKCRTALALTCPNCSFENPPGFDFCGQCAAGLNGDGGIAKAAAAASKPAATVRFVAEEPCRPSTGNSKR